MHGILPLASWAVGPLHLYRLMASGPVYLSSPIILSLYANNVNIFESSNEYIFGVWGTFTMLGGYFCKSELGEE